MATAVAAEPTREQLLAAWQQCRKPTWPATFEAAMADPLFSRLVRLVAKHPPAAHRRAAPAAPAPVTAHPATAPTWWPPRHPQGQTLGIDRKRAASGERDDD